MGANDPLEIPLRGGIGYYDMGTSIQGVHYWIDARWNASSSPGPNPGDPPRGAWYLDFFESDRTPIILNQKLVLGTYIGRRSQHPLFKNGVFVAIDMTNTGTDARFDDLGGRVILEYIPVIELIRRIQDYG